MAVGQKAKTGDRPRPGGSSSDTSILDGVTPSGADDHQPEAGETTPLLLGSRSTSPTTPGSVSPQRRQRRIGDDDDDHDGHGHDNDDDNDDDDADIIQHPVTTARAVCISLTLGILIWVKASNMSGMTMVQGHIAEDLEAYDEAMWFTSVYLIVVASAAPLAGRLATVVPVGATLLASALFFAAGSVVSARAASSAAFIAGRVLAGVGGGSVITLSLVLVFQLTSPRRRGLFVGVVNTAFTVGIATGAVVFGALLPVVGWRWLFLLQAPVGLLSGLGVYLSVPDFKTTTTMGTTASRRKNNDNKKKPDDGPSGKTTLQKLKTIDYAGAVLLTASIVLFLYGLSGTIQPLPMLLSAAPLALFLLNEYRIAPDPLIPISVLQSRGVLLSCLSQLGLMAARWAVLFYTPVFVLAVRGLSPAAAGAVLIPTNLGFGAGGLLVGWLHVRRAGAFWLPSLAAIALFGAALLGLARAGTAAAPAGLYVALVFANGVCTGAALNYTLAHVLHVAAPGTHYVATGLWTTFRGFAGCFGTSIGGGVFARRLREELARGFAQLDGGGGGDGGGGELSPGRVELIKRLVGSPNLVFGGSLSEAERGVAVHGYEVALRTLYTYAVILTVFVLFLQAGTGWTAPPPAPVPVGQEDEEETRLEEEFAEHDQRMEA